MPSSIASNWQLPHGLGGLKVKKWVPSLPIAREGPKRKSAVKPEAEHLQSPTSIEASTPELTDRTSESSAKDEAEADIPKSILIKAVKNYKYGVSKFPSHSGPKPEQCNLVHQLLVSVHGEAIQPDVLPPASKTRAGCGDVAKVFEAVIRTIISSAITMGCANTMVQRLVQEYPMPEDSMLTINFEFIRVHVNQEQLAKVINVGGIQNGKAKNIKESIDMVYEKNIQLVFALQKELDTGIKTKITATSPEFPALSELSPKQKTDVIALVKEDPLTLNWLHEITDDVTVLKVLLNFPGVGLKTASCVSLFSLHRDSFAVDTHVQRFCTWLKWVPDNVPGTAREKTFNHLDPKIPGHLKYGLHQLFIRHGQDCHRCKAGTKAGSKKWDETECVLESLLDRSLVYDKVAEGKKNKGKKGVSDVEEEGATQDADGEAKSVGMKTGSRAKRAREDDDNEEYEDKPAKKQRVTKPKKGVASKKVAVLKNGIKNYFPKSR